jgi:hypothetical protein
MAEEHSPDVACRMPVSEQAYIARADTPKLKLKLPSVAEWLCCLKRRNVSAQKNRASRKRRLGKRDAVFMEIF